MSGIDYSLLINQLKRHEGTRLKVYKCPAGKWTVGVGRNLEDKGITKKEAEYLLQNDIEECENKLEQLLWYRSLDSTRKAIMINMAFNMGFKGLMKFKKMIKYIEQKNWNRIADEMLNSRWAKQVGNRAFELANQMRSGFFQEEIS